MLGTTRHIQLWQSGLQMLHSASIRQLRYSVPWHRIERECGKFDFTWMDDPLHHISFPDWLDQGFANPQFRWLYERFITELARRYPWVNSYTLFNETLPTMLFCSYTRWWYPHQALDDCFVRMAMNVARATCRAAAALRKLNPSVSFVHIDTCDIGLFWLYWDAELERANIAWPVRQPVGFAGIALEYAERFQVPIFLSQTNLRGSYLDRLIWLKFMEEQCETLSAQTDFRGFCWYPSIDSTDSLAVRTHEGPVGYMQLMSGWAWHPQYAAAA